MISILDALLKVSEGLKADQDLMDSQKTLFAKKNNEVEEKSHKTQDKERELAKQESDLQAREKVLADAKDSLLVREKALSSDKEVMAIEEAALKKVREKLDAETRTQDEIVRMSEDLKKWEIALGNKEKILESNNYQQHLREQELAKEWQALEAEKARVQKEAEKIAKY